MYIRSTGSTSKDSRRKACINKYANEGQPKDTCNVNDESM